MLKSRITDRLTNWMREIARQEIAAREKRITAATTALQRKLDLERAHRYTEWPPSCYRDGEWRADVEYVNELRAKVGLPDVSATDLQATLTRRFDEARRR